MQDKYLVTIVRVYEKWTYLICNIGEIMLVKFRDCNLFFIIIMYKRNIICLSCVSIYQPRLL